MLFSELFTPGVIKKVNEYELTNFGGTCLHFIAHPKPKEQIFLRKILT